MKQRTGVLTLLATVVLLGATVVPAAGQQQQRQPAAGNQRLQMYEAVVDATTVEQLTSEGYDVASIERVLDGYLVTLVLYPFQRVGLEKQGIDLELWENDAGLTSTELAEQQAAAGFKVWMDYDGPDGFRAYMYNLAEANEDILDLHVLGTTYGTDPEGDEDDTPREIIGLRLTNEDTDEDGEKKPAVLYSSMVHAREWIAGEVNRRLLEWFIKGWREEKPQVVDILDSTELWFVLVQNPDGYQYTFDYDRLWRKNLRDNDLDGDGPLLPDNQITIGDGVDGNRNFEEHWGFDDEGSASLTSDETYRGPSAMSEPETQALDQVLQMSEPKYHISYHSFGELLLYPFGFQVNTPSADDPLFVAWAGTDKKPAVQGYNPGVGADLYTTNGEQTDYAYSEYGALSITPELGEGNQNSGFEFPDSEGEVEHEFKINLDFAVAAAKSAADPDNTASPVNIKPEPFYLNTATIDPQKSFNPMSDFTFAHSFNGAEQPVRVLARRNLDNAGGNDAVRLHYRFDGELQTPPQGLATTEWDEGDRYGDSGDVYYRVMQGTVTDAPAGTDVEVWFTGAGKTSPSFTFHVEKEEANDVLILADTDYTGTSNFPAYTGADGMPPFLSDYEDAIEAAGYVDNYDVYDVDALGAAPDHLGVLLHYDAVVWYTANDLLSRIAGQPGGTGAETQANTMMLEVRAFLNEDGKLLYTGRHAGWQFANAFDYNPVSTPPLCDAVDLEADDGCLFLSDDFLQYWLGAYIFVDDGGAREDGTSFDVSGADDPYVGLGPWAIDQAFDPGRGASNQSFITTSSLLDEATFPQFTSSAPGVWDTDVAGPYSPHEGDFYMYSQRADIRYQRLMNTFTVDSGTELSFFISYDTEPNWDFVFVELQDADGNWVTLPEASEPSFTSDSTGESCREGWHELHPFLANYQGDCGTDTDGDGLPNASGWNAASGRSHGWENWVFDLSAYEGQEVTVSISYASDWAIQGLGAFVDDITAPTTAAGVSTGFEDGEANSWFLGDPTDLVPPSGINVLDWTRTTDVGYVEGAMTSMTPGNADFRTLYFGFGFENVADPDDRAEIMAEALQYLIAP